MSGSMAEIATREHSPEFYLERLAESRKQYWSNIREIRDEVLRDEDIDPIHRAILGTGGSIDQLDEYRRLARKIGSSIGEPLICIERLANDEIDQALGGIIAGPVALSVELPPVQTEPTRNETKVRLVVPIRNAVDYYAGRTHVTTPHGDEEADIADFVWHNNGRTARDPAQDFHSQIAIEHVLIGRPTIYNSPFFKQGLSKILLAVEHSVRECPPAEVATTTTPA